ncbi:MAG: hypothetical protein ACFE9Z_07820 [Promethearchaeota archaeon]
MNIKGIAFKHIKDAHISAFGEERWNSFFQRFKKDYTEFPNVIIGVSQIPIDLYLPLVDDVIKEFYNGNHKVLWGFGEYAAQISLSDQGYFNVYIKEKTPENFINNFLAHIWTQYYDEGMEEFEIEGNILHARIFNLPKYHPHFELITMGYIKKALELIGVNVKETTKIKSSAEEIYYQFTLDL